MGKWRGRREREKEKEEKRAKEREGGRGRESREDDSGPINSNASEATVEKRREQALERSDCFRNLQLFKEAKQILKQNENIFLRCKKQ